MTMKKIKDSLSDFIKLNNEIKKHQKAYHNDDQPVISDEHYDLLCKKLIWAKIGLAKNCYQQI